MRMEGDNSLMRADFQWMRRKYNEMNQELFGGVLGDCDFDIFTTGKGSQGGVLGWFCIQNKNVRTDSYTRRLFANTFDDTVYITQKNFAKICRPKISLNGNYSGTEESLTATLVHEMCHYYDYMYGTCPKQGHGPSFRYIAQIVSNRSNGRFTIQRIASAEEMRGYVLDPEMQAKKEARTANKKAKAMAIFVYKRNGEIEITLTSRQNTEILDKIVRYYTLNKAGDANEIITSTDQSLIELLYANKYRKLMRTWRYWNVQNQPWANMIKDYDYNVVFNKNNITKDILTKYTDKKEGVTNMEESKLNQIIEATVKDYVSSIVNDEETVQVGGINLGLKSPLENN